MDEENLICNYFELLEKQTGTVSFASVFIVLPKIIAEYLFNTSDEKNMVDIIKNMQEYDKSLRENIKK